MHWHNSHRNLLCTRVAAFALLASPACRSPDTLNQGSTTLNDTKRLDPIACDDGTTASPYTFEALVDRPPTSLYGSFFRPGASYASGPTGPDWSETRLDICKPLSGNAKLVRLAIRSQFGRLVLTPEQGPSWTIQGFEGAPKDPSILWEVQAVNYEDGEEASGLLIKSWLHQGKPFQTFGLANREQGVWTSDSLAINAGTLIASDPFLGPCGFAGTHVTPTFKFGDAQFKAEICTRYGTGETIDYDLIRIEVQDASPKLAAHRRGRVEVLEGNKLATALADGSFRFKEFHHNTTESFRWRLPRVPADTEGSQPIEYAATTPAIAGCTPTVENAPPWPCWVPVPSPRQTHYRINYGNGFEPTRGAGLTHYFGIHKFSDTPKTESLVEPEVVATFLGLGYEVALMRPKAADLCFLHDGTFPNQPTISSDALTKAWSQSPIFMDALVRATGAMSPEILAIQILTKKVGSEAQPIKIGVSYRTPGAATADLTVVPCAATP